MPLTQVSATLCKTSLISLWKSSYEAVSVRDLRCLHAFFVCRVKPSISNVLHHRPREQKVDLQHDAQLAAQAGLLHLADVLPVDGDRPCVDVVKARQQVDDRRLARPGRPDQGDRLPWLRGQADMEPTLRWWRWVAEVVRRDPELPDRTVREKRARPQEAETWKWAAAADAEELAETIRQALGQTEAPGAPRLWDDRAYNDPSQPVVGVCWYEAMAYCAWLTERINESPNQRIIVRLPSEAEWEKAARWDGKRARRFPWGDDWDPFQCNSLEGRVLTTTPVGIYPDGVSPCGALDMVGNVWGWTCSLWGSDIERPAFEYPYDPEDGREDEESGDLRVLRGGSWHDDRDFARCAFRFRVDPHFSGSDLGFRLVSPVLF